jgi:hypothetical protein
VQKTCPLSGFGQVSLIGKVCQNEGPTTGVPQPDFGSMVKIGNMFIGHGCAPLEVNP